MVHEEGGTVSNDRLYLEDGTILDTALNAELTSL